MKKLYLYTQDDAKVDLAAGVSGLECEVRTWQSLQEVAQEMTDKLQYPTGLCRAYSCSGNPHNRKSCPLVAIDGVRCGSANSSFDHILASAKSLLNNTNSMLTKLKSFREEDKHEPIRFTGPYGG